MSQLTAVVLLFCATTTPAFLPPNNETNTGAEADYCNIEFPQVINGITGQSFSAYGRIFEAGVTQTPGPSSAVQAYFGYGCPGTDPWGIGWQFFSVSYNIQVGNDDEYVFSGTIPAPGSYSYVFAFSLDGGQTATYADVDGAGSNAGLTFSTTQMGVMTSFASDFLSPPAPAVACGGCCDTPGDADNAGDVNIGDVTFLIAYIFSGGAAPVCAQEADADAGGDISIGDAVYLIAYIFQGGPAPICGP